MCLERGVCAKRTTVAIGKNPVRNHRKPSNDWSISAPQCMFILKGLDGLNLVKLWQSNMASLKIPIKIKNGAS